MHLVKAAEKIMHPSIWAGGVSYVQGSGYGVVAGGIGVKVTFDPFSH